MATILDFRVNLLLVNPKIHEILAHKIFQTQKWVNFTFPKTSPHMTLSNDTNHLAVPAVFKNFILMTPFLAPGNTVWFESHQRHNYSLILLKLYIFLLFSKNLISNTKNTQINWVE